MYTPILNLHTWVSLPNEVRTKMRMIFSIPRSGNTLVNDGRVETDGTTPEDISHLTILKMQEYLGSSETDFNKLFNDTVSRIKDEIAGVPITNANINENVKEEPQESKQIKKTNSKRNTVK